MALWGKGASPNSPEFVCRHLCMGACLASLGCSLQTSIHSILFYLLFLALPEYLRGISNLIYSNRTLDFPPAPPMLPSLSKCHDHLPRFLRLKSSIPLFSSQHIPNPWANYFDSLALFPQSFLILSSSAHLATTTVGQWEVGVPWSSCTWSTPVASSQPPCVCLAPCIP